MPGPKSKPWARVNGRVVQGKSALKRAGATSRQNVLPDDIPPVFKEEKSDKKPKGDDK